MRGSVMVLVGLALLVLILGAWEVWTALFAVSATAENEAAEPIGETDFRLLLGAGLLTVGGLCACLAWLSTLAEKKKPRHHAPGGDVALG